MNILFLALAALLPTAPAHCAASTQLTWHGHAAWQLVTPKGRVLWIDPWLKNPKNPAAKTGDPVAAVKRADYILLTHGHFDHVGDAVALAQATKARLVANFELGTNLARLLGFPPDQMGFDTLMNVGGRISIADGEVTVEMTPAVHSSGLDAGDQKQGVAYGGNPGGFIIRVKDGPTIYDTGDTAYFKDMDQIAGADVDVALINVGGHFGMEPDAAAQAARAVNPKLVVPHHFGTFPILTQDLGEFFKELDEDKIAHRELKPGQTLTFNGREPQP